MIDKLSFLLGRFDLDCYLIGRGVRFIGTHEFSSQNYKAIGDRITKIAKENEVELYMETDKDSQVSLVVYHPTEGKKWLERLLKLDKEMAEETQGSVEKIFEKVVKKDALSDQEKRVLKEITQSYIEKEREYGQIFGYTESSIARYIEKVY